jgi:hypothetical protein
MLLHLNDYSQHYVYPTELNYESRIFCQSIYNIYTKSKNKTIFKVVCDSFLNLDNEVMVQHNIYTFGREFQAEFSLNGNVWPMIRTLGNRNKKKRKGIILYDSR